jgi:hypothetical protein
LPLGLKQQHFNNTEFQNSEYEVHQVGPNNSGSLNFSFLAHKAKAVGVTQICSNGGGGAAMATARDGRNFFYRSSHVIYS